MQRTDTLANGNITVFLKQCSPGCAREACPEEAAAHAGPGYGRPHDGRASDRNATAQLQGCFPPCNEAGAATLHVYFSPEDYNMCLMLLQGRSNHEKRNEAKACSVLGPLVCKILGFGNIQSGSQHLARPGPP